MLAGHPVPAPHCPPTPTQPTPYLQLISPLCPPPHPGPAGAGRRCRQGGVGRRVPSHLAWLSPELLAPCLLPHASCPRGGPHLGLTVWALPPALWGDSQLAQCTQGTGKLRFPSSLNTGGDAHEPRCARLCLPVPSVGYGVSLPSAWAGGDTPVPPSPHGTPARAVGLCTPVGLGVQRRPSGTIFCCDGIPSTRRCDGR